MKILIILLLFVLLPMTTAQETNPTGDFYNEAVAAINAQDTPKGLLLLHRALLIAPRDGDIQNAINQVRFALELDNDDDFSPVTIGRLTRNFVTFEELSVILWGCWVAASFVAMFYFSHRQRSWFLRSTLIVLLSLSASGAVLLALRQRMDATDAILLQMVIPRSGPGMDYLPLTELTAGNEINVTAERGEWLQFRSNTGTTGWLQSEEATYIIPRG